MAKRKRKRRGERARAARREAAPPARGSRAEARDAEVRAGLEPLAPDERPAAVTVAAIAAGVLAIANVVAALVVDFGGTGSRVTFAIIQSVVLVVAAAGMWRAKYWAVLGFQALLGIQILNLALALTKASNALVALGVVAIIAALGFLFWKLVRAMARLQMPRGPRPQP